MNTSTVSKSVRALFLSLFIPLCMNAQDIHFSQFDNVPMHLSPALTGVFNGDLRFNGNYRSQWHDVPITYRTAYFAVDKKWYTCEKKTNFFGGGAVFFYDWAGDGNLSTGHLSLNGSYTHRLTHKSYLTAGLQLSGYQRKFDEADLRFDAQYTGKEYNSNLSNRETFEDTNIFYGDVGLGLNYHFQHPDGKSRTTFDLGAGLLHINTPQKSFYDDPDEELPARLALYGLGTIQLRSKLDVVLRLTGGFQGPHREYLIGAGIKPHLNLEKTKELAVLLGLSYRFNRGGFGTGDALIPNAEVHYKTWRFGLSYDINISGFDIATGGFGGPEFSAIYTFKKPVENFCPTCPTYL